MTKDIPFLDSETLTSGDKTFLMTGKYCRRPSENGIHSDHGCLKANDLSPAFCSSVKKIYILEQKEKLLCCCLMHHSSSESQTVGSRPAAYGLASITTSGDVINST
jgi:hypothetical protein